MVHPLRSHLISWSQFCKWEKSINHKPVTVCEEETSLWPSSEARTHTCLFLLHVLPSFHPHAIPKPGRVANLPQSLKKKQQQQMPKSFFTGHNHQRRDLEMSFWVLFSCLPSSSAPVSSPMAPTPRHLVSHWTHSPRPMLLLVWPLASSMKTSACRADSNRGVKGPKGHSNLLSAQRILCSCTHYHTSSTINEASGLKSCPRESRVSKQAVCEPLDDTSRGTGKANGYLVGSIPKRITPVG